jgi:peptide chain release factor 2
VGRRRGPCGELVELAELLELGGRAGPAAAAELERESERLEREIEKLELKNMLRGNDDHRDALVTIHPGAGGTESQDWAEMLMRMYTRWAEGHDYDVEVLNLMPGRGSRDQERDARDHGAGSPTAT